MGDFPFLDWLTRKYMKKAEETGHWSDYLKAHGLANACLVRDQTEKRTKLVYTIEETWYQGKHPLSYTEHCQLTKRHKHLLSEFRSETKHNFDGLRSEGETLSISNIFSQANLVNAKNFSTNVFAMSKRCSDEFVQVSRQFIQSSVDLLSSQELHHPCNFAVIGLGSAARGEATPYSDLEYAFIIESHHEVYFEKLAVDSYFRIGNIGETPLRCFNIEELKVVTGEGPQPMLSDVSEGYRIDGISELAGNIPTGGVGGQSLTLTVDQFMDLYKTELRKPLQRAPSGKLKIGDLSDLLSSSVLVYSSEGDCSVVYDDFIQQRLHYEETEAKFDRRASAKRVTTLSCDIKQRDFIPRFQFSEPNNLSIKVKADIFRYPTLLAHNLKICLGLKLPYPWDTFSDLHEEGVLSDDHYCYMNILLALSIYIRTTAYLTLGKQSELLSLYSPAAEHSDDRYHVPLDVFVTLGCLLVPVKESISSILGRSASSAMTANTNVGELIRSLVQNSLKVDKSDYMLKAEVLYFTGNYAEALTQLSNDIGSDMHKLACPDFIQIIREKYNISKSDVAEKKYIELCCFLLMAAADTSGYERAVDYISWFVSYLKGNANIASWKLLMAQCMEGCMKYKAAKGVLEQAKVLLREELGLGVQQPLAEYVLGKLSKGETISDRDLFIYSLVQKAYNQIGLVYHELSHNDIALQYHTGSLDIWRAIYGADTNHRAKAVCYHNIAQVYAALGQHDSALQYYNSSLDMYIAIYGENTNHPEIAVCYNSIGSVYNELGQYDGTLHYSIRALDMTIAIHGKNANHPSIASCYINIASGCNQTGQRDIALRYLTRALDMMIAIYGATTNHPDIAMCYNNIGWVKNQLGQHDGALRCYNSSLDMYLAIYGENTNHRDIALCYHNIDRVYSSLGQYDFALQYSIRALEMNIAIHGENTNHFSIAISYNNIGSVYHELGQHDSALRYHIRALDMYIAMHGENTNHPDIAICYRIIGGVYSTLGKHHIVLQHLPTYLDMKINVHVENTDCPEVSVSYHTDGEMLQRCKYFDLALSCYIKAISMCSNPNDRDLLVNVIYSIAEVWVELHDYRRAHQFSQIALKMVPGSSIELKSDINFLIGKCLLHLQQWKASWLSLHSALCGYQSLAQSRLGTFSLAEVHVVIGFLLLHLGYVSQSLEHSQTALDLSGSLLADSKSTTPKIRRLYNQAESLTHILQLLKVCQYKFATFTKRS